MYAEYGSSNPLLDIWVVWSLAVVHAARGAYARAEHYFERLFAQFDDIGLSGPQRSAALYSWGWTGWLQGRCDQATEAYWRMGASS